MKRKSHTADRLSLRMSSSPSVRDNPLSYAVRVLTVDFMANQPKYSVGLTSQRRPQTSYSDRHFAPSPRIRSASCKQDSAISAMPRSHVSIARFYDWSEDLGDCVSVSKLYRDAAGMPRINGDKLKERSKRWCSNGVHINPGRMFLRDKAGLTKGEREIIEGIYRNRSDMQREDAPTSQSLPNVKDEWHFVRSHKDAWLIGKNNVNKTPNKFDPSSEVKLPDHIFSRSSDVVINSPRDLVFNHNETSNSHTAHDKHDEVLVAPPTTPDKEILNVSLSNLNGNGYRRPVYQCGEGSVLPENADSRYLNSRGETRKKKIFVNVFLPQQASIESVHGGLRREGARFSRYTNDAISTSSVFSYPDSRKSQRGISALGNAAVGD